MSAQRRLSRSQPSVNPSTQSSPPLFKGLSDSSWQVQLFSQFQGFQKQYNRDQKRQKAFEASMFKMVKELKKSFALAHYGSTESPSLSVSSPPFHHESFGDSSLQQDVHPDVSSDHPVDPSAASQGEPPSSPQLDK